MNDPCATPGLLGVDDAVSMMLARVSSITDTEITTIEQACGRVLAETILSTINVPGYDNSAMDGYAVRSRDVTSAGKLLPVSQRIAAGQVGEPLQPGTAARIFTGAPIPDDADSVVMQEQCEQTNDIVVVNTLVSAGMNIRKAGEDIASGSVVLKAGNRIRPQEAGLLASVGQADAVVYRKLRVAVFFTGDELVEPGNTLGEGRIYNSNRYTLVSMLQQLGCDVKNYGIVEDTLETTTEVLGRAAAEADLVMTSGGVSVGEEDHVRLALEQLGELNMWRIAMKPGKPVAFGHIDETVFIGLPGNPVSVFVTALVFATPVIRKMQGIFDHRTAPVLLKAGFDWKQGKRQEYLRVRHEVTPDGSRLELFPHQGSGVLSSVSWATGLAIACPGREIRSGDLVDYIPFLS